MNCSKCKKIVNEHEIVYQDKLPPKVGYPSPTVVRCSICKEVICEKCYYGWGQFVFTCENKCKNEMRSILND